MRTARLLAVLLVALALSPYFVRPANAQVQPSCSTGCVGVSVTPDGSNISQSASTGPFTATFTVENTGTLSATYTFACSKTGGITCGTVTPASATIAGLNERVVQVSYSVGATPGTVKLTATGPDIDDGFYNINLYNPPIVALRNFSDSIVDRSLCLTSGAGQSAAYSCGDLVVTHALPAYRTMGRDRSLTLIYNSGTAQPQPVIVVAVTEGGTTTIPNSVELQLTVNGAVVKTVTFAGSSWGSGPAATRQLAISYDATTTPTGGTATGAYPFTLRVRNQYTGATKDATRSGILLIVNRSSSEFGKGVGLAGVEQLIPGQPSGSSSLMWIGGDGSAKLYRQTNSTTWAAPSGAYQDTIKLANSVYTRSLRHNVKVAFDASGHHISTTNKAGHVTTFTWPSTRLTSITVPPGGAGTLYSLKYGTDTRLDTIIDPAGRKLAVTIGSGGLLAKVMDPDNFETSFSYLPNTGLMSSRTNRRGNTTLFAYSNGRRLTKVTIAVGRTPTDTATSVTQFAPWDEKGLVTPVDTAKGYTAVYGPRFRASSPVVSDTAAFWLDRFGAPTRLVGPLGFQTSIKREDSRFPALATKVIYPSKQVVVMQYDARSNLLQVRDSSDAALPASERLPTEATTYVYGTGAFRDMPTRVEDSTETLGQPLVTNFAYDATTGLTKQATAPNGHVTKFAYSSQATSKNLVKAVTESAVPVWDQAGESLVVDSLHTGLAFNNVGNVTADTSPSGRVTKDILDSYQRVGDRYDPVGHRVQYTYDLLNRVTAVTEYVGTATLVTQTTIDTDVVTQVKDPRGVTRAWAYDLADRPISETDDLGHTELRFYNRAGLIDSVRARIFAGTSGPTTRYSYDAAGQRVKMAWPQRAYLGGVAILADSMTYTYDNMGRMKAVAMVDTALWQPKKIVRTYYARGELKSEVQSHVDDTGTFTHTYQYDRMGRRKAYTIGTPGSIPNSDAITYTYTPSGDLDAMSIRWRGKSSADETIKFSWDALGRRDSIGFRKGAYLRFAYDRDGALRVVCGSDAIPNPLNPDPSHFTINHSIVDGEGLIKKTVTVLANPQPLGCAANALLSYTQTNGYDERHQLVSTSRAGVSHAYEYDNSGNMTRDDKTGTTEDYDYVIATKTNQLVQRLRFSGPASHYFYDENGARSFDCPGLTTCDNNDLNYRRYFYDALGRLLGTEEHAQSQGYYPEYDPLGRLTQATDAPAQLGYDGDNVVRTGYDNDPASWTFIHGPGIDDPLIGHYAVLSAGQLQDALLVYYGTDGHGRQYAVADSMGRDVSDHAYYRDQGGRYAGGTVNAEGFDAERSSSTVMSGLSFFRNRFYDSQTGRWTQEDPIGVAGGLNLYQFNGNNPVAYTDPFGLCPRGSSVCPLIEFTTTVLGGIGGFIAGGGAGALVTAGTGGLGAPAIPSLAVEGALGGAAGGLGLGKAITNLMFSEGQGGGGSAGRSGQAARQWLGQTNRQNPGLNRAMSKWFKEGGDLPEGITREYLENYRTAAQDVIDRGVDRLGVQADRVRMIDEALGGMR